MGESRGRALAKNTVIIAVGKICTQFLNFFLLPLYTAILSKEEYGSVDLLNTYVSLLLPIVTLQVEQGVFRFLVDARGKEKRVREVISVSLAFVTTSCFLLSILFVIFRKRIESEYILYLLLNLVVIAVSGMFLQVARGLGKMVSYALGSFLSGAVTVILNIVFLVCMHQGVVGMLRAIFLGNLVCIVYLMFSTGIVKYFSLREIRVSALKEILKYSAPLVPNTLAWWAISASDRTIVSLYMNVGYNGILTVAHKFSSIYMTIYNVFNYAWTEAAVVNSSETQGVAFLDKMINTAFDFFASMCIGVISCVALAFPFLINASYNEAYVYVPFFMLASFFNVLTSMYGALYIAQKRTKQIAVTTVIIGIINVLVNISLVSSIGLWASAISSVVAYGAIMIYRARDCYKSMGVKVKCKKILTAAIMYCVTVFFYLKNHMVTNIISLAIAIAYAYIANKELIHTLLKNVGKRKRKIQK